MSSIFKKASQANENGGGNWVNDGRYVFMIEALREHNGHEGTSFIAELRVVHSEPDPMTPDVKPNPVGSSCSFVQNATKFPSAMGNIKAFFLGLLGGMGFDKPGVEAFMADDAKMNAITGPAQPLRGALVGDNTYRGTNKGRMNPANAGKPLTLHKWQSITQDESKIKAGRAYLDANTASSAAATTGQMFAQQPAQQPAPQQPAPVVTQAYAPPVQPAAEQPAASANAVFAALGIKA